MPCYEENLISVDLKAADKEILHEALKSLNLKYEYTNNGSLVIYTNNGSIVIKNGTATLTEDDQAILNKIKQAYAIKTIEHVSAKYKFSISGKTQNKMTLRRY